MRFRFLVGAFFAALFLSGQALAQSWTPVIADQNHNQYDLDQSSVAADGGLTRAWVRQTPPRRQRESGSGKLYSSALLERLDDCRARKFAIIAMIYKDQDGRALASYTIPQVEWRFDTPPPDSVAIAIQNSICGVAARRAALKPSLEVGPATQANWLPMAYDPAGQTRYFLQEGGVVAIEGDTVGVTVRADHLKPATGPDGDVSTAYLAEVIDCKARTMGVVSSDGYDSAGNLTAVFAPSADKVTVHAFVEGSPTDLMAKYACQKDHIAANPDDEGGVFTGTGWLGPKGYVITANHVIEGATNLALAQDGKLVGGAEVVVADPANDIAILRPVFKDGRHLAIPFAPAPARLGEKVFTLGYPAPDVLGVSLKMTSGEVSAMSGNDAASGRSDDARFLQVSIPIHSGNSGGPVIDEQGHAVGIVISKMSRTGADEIAQNVNYALKIAYVRNLLAELPVIETSPPLKPRSSISDLVETLRGSVFLVVASSDKGKGEAN